MNTRQQFIVHSLIIVLGITMPASVFAGEIRNDVKQMYQDRKELREDKKNFIQTVQDNADSVMHKLVNAGKAVIIGGKITAKSDSTLTVEKDGKSYTVNVTEATTLRRRFWGKSDMTEYAIGNSVNVYGSWTDDSQTVLQARMIRNVSIQKRFGVFFGKVKSLLSNGWVMSTVSDKRPDQTITVTAHTTFENRKGDTIVQSDVKVGDRVRVRGLFDSSNNTVSEVTKVKDFSLPVVTTTPTPTP